MDPNQTPKNLGSLLGLGLKFIPTPRTTPKWSRLQTNSVNRLHRDLLLKSYFAGEDIDNAIDTRMYVKSKWTPPPWHFPKALHNRFLSFAYFLRQHFKHCKKKTENLLPHQHRTLKELQQSDTLLVVQCDKNLGLALIE